MSHSTVHVLIVRNFGDSLFSQSLVGAKHLFSQSLNWYWILTVLNSTQYPWHQQLNCCLALSLCVYGRMYLHRCQLSFTGKTKCEKFNTKWSQQCQAQDIGWQFLSASLVVICPQGPHLCVSSCYFYSLLQMMTAIRLTTDLWQNMVSCADYPIITLSVAGRCCGLLCRVCLGWNETTSTSRLVNLGMTRLYLVTYIHVVSLCASVYYDINCCVTMTQCLVTSGMKSKLASLRLLEIKVTIDLIACY